jgi:hypothetical protein
LQISLRVPRRPLVVFGRITNEIANSKRIACYEMSRRSALKDGHFCTASDPLAMIVGAFSCHVFNLTFFLIYLVLQRLSNLAKPI